MVTIKVIILAAGKGERLMPLTKDTPKPLLDLGNGLTILEAQLLSIHKTGITEVVIVTGYLSEKIEQKIESLKEEYPNMNIKVIYNPFFEVSNNLISLWTAKIELNDDFIILNGDDIFHPSVMQKLIKHPTIEMCMVISRKNEYDDDDMKIISEEDKIKKVSKKIEKYLANGESIGMIKVVNEGKYKLINIIESMLKQKENLNTFWLAAIQKYIDTFDKLEHVEVEKNSWREIDFHADRNTINERIKSQMKENLFSIMLDHNERDKTIQ